MKILVNTMTQEELNQYLERIVESAFREGALWVTCGGKEFYPIGDALNSAKNSIIYNGM